jgi:hypothetical protein
MALINYDNSIPMDWNLSFRDKSKIDSVCEYLMKDLKTIMESKRSHLRHTEHLGQILINLLKCHSIDPDMCVAYHRNSARYNNQKRYNSIEISYASTIKIVDALISLGYIEYKKGRYNRDKGEGKISRMRATPKLIDLLTFNYKMDTSEICLCNDEETIILKDESKLIINYTDQKQTREMRKKLKIINDNIAGTYIGLCVPDNTLAEINRELRLKQDENDEDFRSVIDLTKSRLRRIFNNGSFEEGGRLYNGWWQSVPSKYRRYIRIDNIETVEVDYSGYHINLLYAMEGLPLPTEDVYSLNGIPEESRNMLKVVLQILLNAGTEQKALRKIKEEFPRKKHPGVFTNENITHESIIRAFKQKHEAISKYFGSGYGVELQFIDSQIAEEILLALAEKGIVALPIHDSFIVQKEHKKALEDIMEEVVFKRYKKVFKLKIDDSAFKAARKFLLREISPEDVPETLEAYERKFESKWEPPECTRYSLLRDSWAPPVPSPHTNRVKSNKARLARIIKKIK